MDLKAYIVSAAASLGFQRTVIGSLDSMEAEQAQFTAWLSKGYAAGMEYLKRNPHFRTSPQLLYPKAKSAIVVSVSYFTEPPPDPGPAFGRVARYAVGLDYHTVLTVKLNQLKEKIEAITGRTLEGKAFTDDVPLYEQAYAKRSGLGFAGKNTMIIGPKLSGSYNFVAELFCDLELEPDGPYQGTCGKCFRCGDICPTKAIESSGVNAGLCISYLTIENKGGIPLALRPGIGAWVFGCDLCQEICPYNQKPPDTPWAEFQPESGAGHYLDLIDLLGIKSNAEFRRRFVHTPLSRPKRKGLLRNALIVLGNRRPEGADSRLHEFACDEEDPILREHAAWAISRYQEARARNLLKKLLDAERDDAVKSEMQSYFETMYA